MTNATVINTPMNIDGLDIEMVTDGKLNWSHITDARRAKISADFCC